MVDGRHYVHCLNTCQARDRSNRCGGLRPWLRTRQSHSAWLWSAPPVFVSSPGRTIPVDGVNFDIAKSGCVVLPGPVATRDCFRQTAVDMFALVKLITDNPGLSTQLGLDPKRIAYIGQSFGAVLGSMGKSPRTHVKTAGTERRWWTGCRCRPAAESPSACAKYLRLARQLFVPDVLHALRRSSRLTNDATPSKAFDVTEWFNMPGDPLGVRTESYAKARSIPGRTR